MPPILLAVPAISASRSVARFTSRCAGARSRGPAALPNGCDDAVMETDAALAGSLQRTRHVDDFCI
jgi:hypothetical protein